MGWPASDDRVDAAIVVHRHARSPSSARRPLDEVRRAWAAALNAKYWLALYGLGSTRHLA